MGGPKQIAKAVVMSVNQDTLEAIVTHTCWTMLYSFEPYSLCLWFPAKISSNSGCM